MCSEGTDLTAATPLIVLPDMSASDIEAEWENMVRRSKALDQFMDGKINFSQYSEFLDHDGIDVEKYIDDWSANLAHLYALS